MSLRIAGIGAYAPPRYVTAETIAEAWGQFDGAGVRRKAVPAGDEDTLTLAYEAARGSLDAAGVDPMSVRALLVGTTTPPAEEESMPARLVSFLGLPDDAKTRQLTGSTRVGVEALAEGLDETVGDGEAVLAVATDAPRGAPGDGVEHAAGAGAAAVVLAPDGPGTVTDRADYTVTYPGTRFRPAGDGETVDLGVTSYERQAYRETVGGAVSGLANVPAVDAAAVGGPDGKLPYRAADDLGTDNETIRAGATVHDLGDAGAATPLLGLAKAVDGGAVDVLVVGYGSGGEATALVVEGPVPAVVGIEGTDELSYGEYLRLRGVLTPGEPEGGGAYVSVPSWRRTLPQRHRLVAGRCTTCGTLNFPPAGACTGCQTMDEYEAVTLPGTGTVEAATVIGQGGAPPEFVEQQARSGSYVSAIVALDDPEGDEGSVSAPAQVIESDEPPAIGDRVVATIRQVYTQEGVTRYGFKVRPADANR